MLSGAIILAALTGSLAGIGALLLGHGMWAALAVYSGSGIATLAAVVAASQIRPLLAAAAAAMRSAYNRVLPAEVTRRVPSER